MAELRARNPGEPCRVDPLPAPVGGGTFQVDLARAPEAIRELEYALDELQKLKAHAASLGKIDPESRDSVSLDMAAMLGATAVGGPGSLDAALDAGIAEVKHLITAMTDDLARYRATDAAASTAMNHAPSP